MNIADLVVILLVAVLLGFALRTVRKNRKNGGCGCGCSGCCSSCGDSGTKQKHGSSRKKES